jgi:hypothetical protein
VICIASGKPAATAHGKMISGLKCSTNVDNKTGGSKNAQARCGMD